VTVGATWLRAYRSTALFGANLLLAFAVVNGALYVALPRPPSPGTARQVVPGSDAYDAAVRAMVDQPSVRDKVPFFPRLRIEDLAGLALETWVFRGYRYEPWTQFREGPYRGRFVTVDEHGFRTEPASAPWPPDERALNVFVFGGSTTFGYGLPDDQTVPHHLERYLARTASGRRVRVYNFAAGYFFSTQERVLFERLVADGVRPALAVFVDGLNDFYNTTDEPEFTARLEALWGVVQQASTPGLADVLGELPIARGARMLRDQLRPAEGGTAPIARLPPPPHLEPADVLVDRAIRRFEDNRRMIEAVAAAYRIPVTIAWQPVPTYGYDLHYHTFAPRDFGPHERSRLGYPKVAALYRSGSLGPNVVWCADLQERLREPLYIDTVHYSPRMARRVARCLTKAVTRRHLLDGPPA
jgi:hypothetical protein